MKFLAGPPVIFDVGPIQVVIMKLFMNVYKYIIASSVMVILLVSFYCLFRLPRLLMTYKDAKVCEFNHEKICEVLAISLYVNVILSILLFISVIAICLCGIRKI